MIADTHFGDDDIRQYEERPFQIQKKWTEK